MKKIISFFVIITFCCNFLLVSPEIAYAKDQVEEGYIDVVANFEETSSSCLKKEGTIFLPAESIAEFTDYQFSIQDKVLVFEREDEPLTTVLIEEDGKTETMGREYNVDVLKKSGQYYLPLNELFYLLHAQWYEEDGVVYVFSLPETLLDFSYSEDYFKIRENQTKPTELLMNGESEFANTLRTSLAAVFNDFDGKMFLLWWPEKGVTPALDAQYEEALLQLAVDDQRFLEEFGQKEINEKLNEVSVGKAKGDLATFKGYADFVTNVEKLDASNQAIKDTVQWSVDSIKNNKFMEFYPQYNPDVLTPPNLKVLSNRLEKGVDALTIVNSVLNVAETLNRSKQWTEGYVDEIAILSEFDDYRYNKAVTDRIKRVAKRLLDERLNSTDAAVNKTAEEIATVMSSKMFGLSPFGPYWALFQSGMAIAKLNPDYKDSLNEADMAYMVDCMIKTEEVAMGQSETSSDDLSYGILNGDSNDEIKKKMKKFRDSTMLALRLNIRTHAYVYYLNQLVNDTPNWETTGHAKHLKEQILIGYVLLCQVMESQMYDELLYLDDFDNMESDKQGCKREKVSDKVFHKGSDVEQWLKQEPLASMSMCPTGKRTMTAEFMNEESYINSCALGYSQDGPLAEWDDRAGMISAAPCDLDQNGKQELVVTMLKNLNGKNSIDAGIYEKEGGKVVCKDTISLTFGDESVTDYTIIGLVKLKDGKQYLLCQDTPNFMEYTLYTYEDGKFKVAYDLSVKDTGYYQLQDNINGTKQGIWDPMDTTNPAAKYNNLDQGEALQKALLEIGLPQAKSTISSEKVPNYIKNKVGFKWLTGYVNNIKTQDKTMKVTSIITIKDYTGINQSSKQPKDKHFKEEKKDLKTAWNEWMSSNGYQYNIAFHEADYDGDGQKEAFGVAASTPEGIYDGQFPETFMEGVMCFINANGGVSVVNSLQSGSVESKNLKANGKEFFVVNKHYTTELVSTLYGVKAGQAYEAQVPVTMGSIQNNSDGTITALIPNYDRGFHDWDTGFFQYNPSTGDFDLVNKTITASEKYYPNFY